MMELLLVTGAGGFIGHHLVKHLVAEGHRVRGVDLKHPKFEASPAYEFEIADLRRPEACLAVTRDVRQVYHLASDAGDGYVTTDHANVVRNNTVMNLHLLDAARISQVKRFLFSSSSCVYPQYLRKHVALQPLREDDAWPADPEEGYGLEKLYMEKLCQYYAEDFGLETRVARFHNVYGPLDTYEGGREKVPAAICRDVARAETTGVVDVFGDGKQTRSFIYVDDCVEGLHRVMQSDCALPLNLDTGETTTLDQLVSLVAEVAGKSVRIRHQRWMPEGPRGCSSDNALLRHVLGWEPPTSLAEGLARTYAWIAQRVARSCPDVGATVVRASVAGPLREHMITAVG